MKAFDAFIAMTLLAAVIATALGVVWTHHQSRVLFVRLTALQSHRDALNIEYRRLELEQATYAEPRRIDQEARQRLGMIEPTPQDTRLLR